MPNFLQVQISKTITCKQTKNKYDNTDNEWEPRFETNMIS